jgi:signal transduction histidine kinase
VRLLAEGLERGKIKEAPKQHEYFRLIVQECRRLSSLVENVLDFSRIEQGRKEYEFESTDLKALVEQTAASWNLPPMSAKSVSNATCPTNLSPPMWMAALSNRPW